MHGISVCIYGCGSFDLKQTCSYEHSTSTQVSISVSDHAGLLYSQAKALLSLPSTSELAHRIINALAMHGGQRFASQAGETAGVPDDLSRSQSVLGSEPQCRGARSPLLTEVRRTWLPSSCQFWNVSTGLLLRQLHRLGAAAQDSLGVSAEDADADMHRSLVTMFNSRLDM